MSKCKCTMAQSVVGDGCEACNPTLALEYAKERIQQLEQEKTVLVEGLERIAKPKLPVNALVLMKAAEETLKKAGVE